MSNIIITSQCESCKYGTIDDSNKARIKVICNYKNKTYYYGACIPCDYYEKRKDNND